MTCRLSTPWSTFLCGALGLLGLGTHQPSAADFEKPIYACEICEGKFEGTAYSVDDPIRLKKILICQACAKSTERCDICDLAADPRHRLQLDDGRYLCRWDKVDAVLNQTAAFPLYERTKMEVRSLLSHWPPIPGANVEFHLVNKDQFLREYMNSPKLDDPEHMLGLTITRSVSGSNFLHHIYVLSGMRPAQFQAVCAHELTHVWQYEHRTQSRLINRDTEEGFCELIAHKVTALSGDAIELKRIEENDYTHKQINAFLAAEKEYQFFRIIHWLQQGVDSWIDPDNLSHILDVKKPAPSPPTAPRFYTPVPTEVPETLVLKGISRGRNGPFALINNQTLAPREKGKVRLGDTQVMVTCLEIRENEVTIQVEGEPTPRTLIRSTP